MTTPKPIDGNIDGNPKSPSDTTIYALALNLTPDKGINSLLPKAQVDADKIAEFVENVCLQTTQNNGNPVISDARNGHRVQLQQVVMNDLEACPAQTAPDNAQPLSSWRDKAMDAAAQMVVDTEAMKAKLDGPQGRNLVCYSGAVDDEFFHITCHVQ